MSLFKIHTEENGKDVDFGVHGVYADNEEDAIKYAETEIVAIFLSMGYKVEVGRTSKRSIIYGIIYVWDNEDTKYRKIIIWAIEKEKKNAIKEYVNKSEWLKELKQLRAQTKWIPCSERLPEDRRAVLVTAYWHETYQVMMASYFGDGLWWCVPFNNSGEPMQKLKPKAWMPLPASYQGE